MTQPLPDPRREAERARCLSLHLLMGRKLNGWRLSPRAKAIAFEINDLSFGEGLPEVEVWQNELAILTGYSDVCTAKAVSELMEEGVLQVIGRRGAPRIYRLLPKAEMIEPDARPDAAAAAATRATIRERNGGRRPGDELGGQRPLLQTPEEKLRDEQASASATLAIEDDARERGLASPRGAEPLARLPANWQELVARSIRGEEVAWEESSGVKLPAGKVDEVSSQESRGAGEGRAYACASERLNVKTDNVERNNVGLAPGVLPAAPATIVTTNREFGTDAQYAFELVQTVARSGEFNSYRARWRDRCKQEPLVIAEVAADCRDRIRTGEKITNPGGWVFRTVNRLLKPLGRALRIF